MPTGAKDAKKAGQLLQSPKASAKVKSVAGSDLAQTPKKKSSNKKK